MMIHGFENKISSSIGVPNNCGSTGAAMATITS